MRREVLKKSYHKVEGTQLITGVFHSVMFTNHLRLINSVSRDQRKPKMQQTIQETTSILNSNRSSIPLQVLFRVLQLNFEELKSCINTLCLPTF